MLDGDHARATPSRVWLSAHLGLVLLFLYGPILVLMALSFNQAGLPTVWTGFSVEWYGVLLEKDVYKRQGHGGALPRRTRATPGGRARRLEPDDIIRTHLRSVLRVSG